MNYPNHLEETPEDIEGEEYQHFVFDVTIDGWYLCVEGEWDTSPEEWFLSSAWCPDESPVASLFADIIRDSVENSYNYDYYTIGEKVAELVLNAPVHEWTQA